MPASNPAPGDEHALHELLDRFRQQNPDGDADDLRAWAEKERDTAVDEAALESAEQMLRERAEATRLLQPELRTASLDSIFGRRGSREKTAPDMSAESQALSVGRRIGSFRLTRFIARGGMGQVWEAYDEELRRSVALKLVLPERIDARSLQLFAREARAGGRVSHPNLVTTLGYGTDEGLAWIAQELVPGSWTLKDSLDEVRSQESVPKGYYREVAELIGKVADGVQAAHDAGVIHRDLKPQNILIAEDDTPKVTDFGLARVTDESVMSQSGEVAGTWAYMSPEQVTAKRMGLDSRSDVFSLGVVLYELLTLRRPFQGDTTHQIAAQIIAVDPPDANRIRSQCPRELAVVCGKALEKHPDRRYGSMGELAADLRRHLADEPVLAKPPTAVERATKWVRRHPTVSAAVAVGLIALGLVSSLLVKNMKTNRRLEGANARLEEQTRIAQENKAAAETNAAQAEERAKELASVNADLAQTATSLREQTELAKERAYEAEEERGKTAAALEREKQRAAELEEVTEFQQARLAGLEPESMGLFLRQGLRGKLREREERRGRSREVTEALLLEYDQWVAGADFTGLGLETLAAQILEPALEEIDEGFEDQPRVRASLLQTVASTALEVGLLDLALAPQREALEVMRRELGGTDPKTLNAIGNLGRLLTARGELREAEPLHLEAVTASRQELGDEDRVTLTYLNDLGLLLLEQDKLPEAETYLRGAVETARRVLGDGHEDTVSYLGSLGQLLQAQGKLEEAESCLREALETGRRVLGDEHSATRAAVNNMGALMFAQGKLAEVESYVRKTLETSRRLLGDEHPKTLVAVKNLGFVLLRQGKLSEAEPFLRETLKARHRVLGHEHPKTLYAGGDLGTLLLEQGKLPEAEALLLEVLETTRRVQGNDHQDTLDAISKMAAVLQKQGKLSEAEPLYREALGTSRRVLVPGHPSLIVHLGNLGRLLQEKGQLSEAEPHLREALGPSRQVLGDRHQYTEVLLRSEHRVLLELKRLDDARALLNDFLATTDLPQDHPLRLGVRGLLEDGKGD